MTNLPYEDVPGGPFDMYGEFLICGHVDYRSVVFELNGKKMAGIVWDFTLASGERVPPILLAVADHELLQLPEEIRKAVRSARREAGR